MMKLALALALVAHLASAQTINCAPISPSSLGTPFIWLRLDELQSMQRVCTWPSFGSKSNLNGTYGVVSSQNAANFSCPFMWNTTGDALVGPNVTYRPLRFTANSAMQVSGFDWASNKNHTIVYAVKQVSGGARQRALAAITNNWLFGWHFGYTNRM